MHDPALQEALRRLAACDERQPIDAEHDDDRLAADGWIAASELANPRGGSPRMSPGATETR